jgi:hypothetical protein
MRLLDSLLRRNREPKPEDGNPSLVKAMHELALSDDPENRKKLYQAILGAMLLVPVPETPKGLGPGLQTTSGDIQIQLTGVVDRNNVRVTTAFTDAEALRNWDPNTPYLGLKAPELFRFVMGTDIQAIVINPFDPIRKDDSAWWAGNARRNRFARQWGNPQPRWPKKCTIPTQSE